MPSTTLSPEPSLVRIPMSREEYDALPESKTKIEWVEGEAIILNAATFAHNIAFARLMKDIMTACPDLDVVSDTDLEMPGRVRRPDVMVVKEWPEGPRVTAPPLVVIEVLSGSTWRQDLVAKSEEYAAFGVGQYWVVDVEQPWMSIRKNVGGGWQTIADLTLENPTDEVPIGDFGTVHVDLRTLVGPRPSATNTDSQTI